MKTKKIPELIILVGPPGSGKSTWASEIVSKHNDFVKVGRDDLRKQFKNSYVVGEDIEILISKAQDELIQTLLENKYSVVVDNTHCKIKYIKELVTKYAPISSVSVKYIGSDVNLKELLKRNETRTKKVPVDVIERMYKNFNTVVKSKAAIQDHINHTYGLDLDLGFKQDPKLPKALIFDIDGNVADMGDGRGPFEWHKVDQDAPIESILNLARALSNYYNIVWMSGRDASCRDLTIQWLQIYYKNVDIELYMRPQGDFRKDSEIKEELFLKYVAPKYYVEAVFDDRDQVVSTWRKKLKLKCLQTAYGNF